jgi:hypothetical protein
MLHIGDHAQLVVSDPLLEGKPWCQRCSASFAKHFKQPKFQKNADATVNSGIQRVENNKRDRGQPKLTWEEAVKGIRGIWLLSAINVPESLFTTHTLFTLCSLFGFHTFLLGFMSSLPQLAWDKRL